MTPARPAAANELEAWTRGVLGSARPWLEPIAGDAGTRLYFRVHGWHGEALLVMYAPDQADALGRYTDIRDRLAAAGARVPTIRAGDAAAGCLVISDLGTTHYLDVLDATRAPSLYAAALDTLLGLQRNAATAGLPPYDEALLRRELGIFREWYLAVHLQRHLSRAEEAAWNTQCDLLVANALAQPVAFTHRDYHSRNLMYLDEGGPGVLDFQDAVLGPVTYDLASLLLDCYVAWPRPRVRQWALDYRDRLATAGVLDPADDGVFLRWFVLMATQRHLKAMGIFARLHHRDGKSGYLGDIPRTAGYIRAAALEYPELAPLVPWLGDPSAVPAQP
ncbi:MAG: phosphotransferase [Gammaproteobacteria bacterium]|nr:phosphotransferase [Gammaproteobacteria bacterium]